jgi:hypothetical protein
LFEISGQLIELGFPESPIALHPFERGAHRGRRERGATHASTALDGRQPRGLQHADVLGDRGQRHVEAGRELADRAIAATKPRENVATRRVGEGVEGGIEGDG